MSRVWGLKHPTKQGQLAEIPSCCRSEDLNQHPDWIKLILGGLSKDASDTYTITNSNCVKTSSLTCSRHEEADTRMTSHLAFSVQKLQCQRVTIESADTDVLQLRFHHLPRVNGLCEMYVRRSGKYQHFHRILDSLAKKYAGTAKNLTAG